MRIVIVGAGAGGSFLALLLARRGHHAILLDQARLEPAPDVEAAAARAFRTSAPQIVQPHMMMARCRTLLFDLLPDVYEELLAAGAVEAPLSTQMPDTLSDRRPRDGDAELTLLATRRAVLDWVVQRTVAAEPNITVRTGTRGIGLLARRGSLPRVVGVRTSHEDITADVVVDATGR